MKTKKGQFKKTDAVPGSGAGSITATNACIWEGIFHAAENYRSKARNPRAGKLNGARW